MVCIVIYFNYILFASFRAPSEVKEKIIVGLIKIKTTIYYLAEWGSHFIVGPMRKSTIDNMMWELNG